MIKIKKIIEYLDCFDYISKYESDLTNNIDIFLSDIPFLASKQNYEQIRKDNQNLEKISILSKEDLLRFMIECKKFITKNGWFIFKCDDYTNLELYETLKQNYDYIGSIIWNKKQIKLGYYIRKMHEIISLYRTKGASNSYYKYVYKEKNKIKGYMPSIVEIPNCLKGSEHINKTPVGLWELILDSYCDKDHNLLDPFAGTFSIEKAMNNLKYNGIYYGNEIKKPLINNFFNF
jgi:hypothetical protein